MKSILSKPPLVYFLLTILILAAMLLPGYIFALDMIFAPEIKLQTISSSYPFDLLLKIISNALPVWLIQKLLLITILLLCGVGAHCLSEYLIQLNGKVKISWSAYFAGILYIFNPFTYVRFMDGQFAVLLGYAILPFFIKAMFEFFLDKKFDLKTSLRVALYTVAIVIVSIHALGYIAILTLTLLEQFLWQEHRNKQVLLKAAKYSGVAIIIFLALSSYWIIPVLTSNTPREQLVSSFDERYLLSFRTDGSNDVSVTGNVLSMHGYWGDREGRYILPRNVMPMWPLLFAGIFTLAAFGFYKSRGDPRSKILLISAGIAFVLAIGIAADPFKQFNRLLYEYVPFYRGFREPQKFVGLLVLAYAVFGSLGLQALMTHKRYKRHVMWLLAAAIALPLMYTPTFLWGFAGQLKSRQYPSDWAQVNREYIKGAEGAVLFLPWHQYMYFDFADRVIANPGPKYFEGDIIAGDNSEIGLIERQESTAESTTIDMLVADRDVNKLSQNIEYVLLSKNADWQEYDFLNSATQLQLVRETETLKLYRNLYYSQP